MTQVDNVLILNNCSIVDGASADRQEDVHVLIRDGLIEAVSDRPLSSRQGRVIDLRDKTLMPGLIDCHVHVVATEVNLDKNALLPNSLVAARAIHIMRGMLMRGFTTVRDLGGADIGLQQAVDDGTIAGPRLIICGKGFSQTGGHCDYRGRYDTRPTNWVAGRLGALGRVCDGVDALRQAIREEIKGGGQFIKLMMNGGVASPTDPVNFLGFSRDELHAAVEEAEMAQTYVAGHLYTATSIKRAMDCGVHCVEHASLVDAEAAAAIAERGAVAVPTLIIFEALKREGAELGLATASAGKIEDVRLYGQRSLEVLRQALVVMGYGTDLLGPLHRLQSEEFLLRGEVLPRHEVIRSATLDAARVLRMEGKVGCIQPGAFADVIAVDGNPLLDLSLLTGQGRHMPLIIKGGEIIKNELAA
jgi:imidazolonepropionase-like amidohydrolase